MTSYCQDLLKIHGFLGFVWGDCLQIVPWDSSPRFGRFCWNLFQASFPGFFCGAKISPSKVLDLLKLKKNAAFTSNQAELKRGHWDTRVDAAAVGNLPPTPPLSCHVLKGRLRGLLKGIIKGQMMNVSLGRALFSLKTHPWIPMKLVC